MGRVDRVSQSQRSQNMAAIKSAGTKPEQIVGKIVRGCGSKFKRNVRNLPGTPDLVFPLLQKVIFVHGCFWHQHGRCTSGHIPKSNKKYWRLKLLRNKARDKANRAKLRRLGWKSLVVWECSIGKQQKLEDKIFQFLNSY